mgnify:CR=1 FL=1
MRVKILMVADIDVGCPANIAAAKAEAFRRLDSFREAALPSANYGIVLYRIRPDELEAEDLTEGVMVIPEMKGDTDAQDFSDSSRRQ